jgi:poly(A) polymerase
MNPKIISLPKLTSKFPSEVKKIFQVFLKNGDEIKLVGGSVRDLLLNKKLNDFDFATKFLPQETLEILKKNKIKAVPTGVKFGTITAVVNGKNFEITTLRKDLESDGRHCAPEFVDDYFFDAARRDFTINALYLDFKGLLYDYFDGISDLKNKKVKFIGDAAERISEDFLRILRFFRFSCHYATSFNIVALKACIAAKKNLQFLSADRVRNEIFKIFSSAKKQDLLKLLKLLEKSQIRKEIFSTSFKIGNLKKLFKLHEALKTEPSTHLQFFALLVGRDLNLEEIFRRLNFSNEEKKYFKFLFENSLKHQKILNHQDIKRFLTSQKSDFIADFYLLNAVQNFAKIKISDVKKNFKFIREFILPKFPLNGEDVMKLGFKENQIGKTLERAKDFWADGDFKDKKTDLINFLRDFCYRAN